MGGKFKGFGKDDKGAKGKKGKAWGKRSWDTGKGGNGYYSGKGQNIQETNGDQDEGSKADVRGPPTKAALLLAAAAREALGLDAQQTGEDQVEDEEDIALPPLSPDAAEEDDEDAERPAAKHGSYINLLFSGGVFGNSASKKQRTS